MIFQIDYASSGYVCPGICLSTIPVTSTDLFQEYNANPTTYFTYDPQCNDNYARSCNDTSCWVPCLVCHYGEYVASPCTLQHLPYLGCGGCDNPPNAYLPTTVSDCTVASNWVSCDSCTPISEYTNQETGYPYINSCPPFQANMGYASDGTCKPCVSCQGTGYYYQAEPGLTCVTEKTKQCIYTYQDSTGLAVTRPMSFQWGQQRVNGSYSKDINNNAGDKLPVYQPCGSGFPSPGYIPRNPPPSHLLSNTWISDCDVQIVSLLFSFNFIIMTSYVLNPFPCRWECVMKVTTLPMLPKTILWSHAPNVPMHPKPLLVSLSTAYVIRALPHSIRYLPQTLTSKF